VGSSLPLSAQLTLSLLSLLAAAITVIPATAAITVIPATAITVTQATTATTRATTQPTTATAGAATIGLGGGTGTTADIMAAGTGAGGAGDAAGTAAAGTAAGGTAAGGAAAGIGTIDPTHRNAPPALATADQAEGHDRSRRSRSDKVTTVRSEIAAAGIELGDRTNFGGGAPMRIEREDAIVPVVHIDSVPVRNGHEAGAGR
jgi:hypothetical protein